MEKRKDERAPLTIPIRIRIASITEFVEKHSANLSQGGIYVEMNYPPPEKTKVKLEFYLEAVKKSIETEGVVVRSVPEPTVADPLTGMAVKFTDLGKDGKRFIELAVEKFKHRHPSQRIEIPKDLLDEVEQKSRADSDEPTPDS